MTINQPEIIAQLSGVKNLISNEPQKVLFVGQMTSVGTATSGVLIENILDDNSEDTLFGENSMLAMMIRDARELNDVTRFDAIPLDDEAASVAATGEFIFVGTSSTTGKISLVIGSATNHKYTVDIASATADTDIAQSFEALINADTKCPVTASEALGVLTISAVNTGDEGNYILMRTIGSVDGVNLSITGMQAGATNPVVTNLFAAIGENRYQTIVYPSTYDQDEAIDFFDARFNDDVPLDGIVIATSTLDLSTSLTTLGLLNSQSYALALNKQGATGTYIGGSIQEINTSISAQFAALRSLRLTKGSEIAGIVSSSGSLDDFGGPAIASLPYFNTPFIEFELADTGRNWSKIEQDQLTAAGGFFFGNNPGRTNIIVGPVATTYKKDSAGDPDVTFTYMNYVDTSSAIREFFYNNLKSTYSQSRLTEGALYPGITMANASSIAAECDRLYKILSEPDYVLTQGGRAEIKYFKDHRTVSLDMAEGKATITMIVPIVVQLRKMYIDIKIGFSING